MEFLAEGHRYIEGGEAGSLLCGLKKNSEGPMNPTHGSIPQIRF